MKTIAGKLFGASRSTATQTAAGERLAEAKEELIRRFSQICAANAALPARI